MFYPILFEPIIKKMIWGSESWGISCRPLEMGIAANGEFKGKRFDEIIALNRSGFLGTALYKRESFPLLLKWIDARDDLSIQVHPDDSYTSLHENDFFGKTEIWYILEAPQNAFLWVGAQTGVTKETFLDALNSGNVESCLNKQPISAGDVVCLPAGLLHGITSGVRLAEIQQNSDITYRLYDYNRVDANGNPRQLHLEKALDVIDFEDKLRKEKIKGLSIKKDDCIITYYAATNYFALIKYEISGSLNEQSDLERFYIYTCLQGNCQITSTTSSFNVEVAEGDSFLIPAATGEYQINGAATLLKSFVPNIDKDFISPLKTAGFSEQSIHSETYIL